MKGCKGLDSWLGVPLQRRGRWGSDMVGRPQRLTWKNSWSHCDWWVWWDIPLQRRGGEEVIWWGDHEGWLERIPEVTVMLEQQAPPAQYLDICASLHWWLLMPLSTYALGRHVHTCYSVSQPHDIISNSPLFSLPSFLHDSLTMRFRIFPIPLYLVIFVSCPSDVVPHLSATSEVSYFIYMMLRPISY